jgi:hypothetical protein
MDTTTTIDEELFEMANLEPAKTGVDGFVYISTPRHGPRVKYFRKLGKGQPSFSVSIAEAPEVLVSSLGKADTERYAPEVHPICAAQSRAPAQLLGKRRRLAL